MAAVLVRGANRFAVGFSVGSDSLRIGRWLGKLTANLFLLLLVLYDVGGIIIIFILLPMYKC